MLTQEQKDNYINDGICPLCGALSEFDDVNEGVALVNAPGELRSKVKCVNCEAVLTNVFRMSKGSNEAWYTLVDVQTEED